MSKAAKQAPPKPAKNGASKKNGKTKPPPVAVEEHPGLRGEQTTIALTLTPFDAELDRDGRDLDKAKKQCGAWGRTVSVLKEKVRTRMTAKKLQHYYCNGVEVRGKPKDDTPDFDVVVHDPQPTPTTKTASAKA